MLRHLLLPAALTGLTAFAQNLPDEINLSPDGRQLITGNTESSGFYREDTLRTIELTFTQTDWWTQLTNNYNSQTPIWGTMLYNGNTYDSVGVRFKGSTSYFMLPPGSQKKSFDIDMNHFVSGQDVGGYTTINLNNSFQDDSFMREVVYEHFIRRHIPGAKANFVKLVINGENWGVYLNVQGLNDDFIQEWFYSNDGDRWRADVPPGSPGTPGWGDGTAALNWHGTDTADYQGYYTLQERNTANPWDKLVKVCDELNNTPTATLWDSLDVVMNVDRVLWHMASEIAWSDDDSYVYKGKMDYSLYWEPESGRMTTQEYDGNTVLEGMNLTWSPFYHANDVNYPLLNKLLAVPELRQRYLAHLRTIVTEELDQTGFDDLVDTYKALIDAEVQADTKKLMTYAEFTVGVNMLKNNRTSRVNTIGGNTEYQQVAPSIANTEHEVAAGLNEDPQAGEATAVRTTVTATGGIFGVNLYHSTTLWGRFTRTSMFDDGAHNDGAAGDGVFGGTIPGNPTGTWVRYYIEAVANNVPKSVRYDPPGAEHNVYVFKVAIPVATSGVVINELMADNSLTHVDEAGEFEDWIELYNNSPSTTDIGLWFMSDSPFEPYKWRFPVGTSIPGNGYLIVWCDNDESQGDTHTNFKLSNAGESALLLTDDSLLVDEVSFGAQQTDMGYARVPNGTGPFVIQQSTYAANNNTVGIAEASSTTDLRVYPNPATTAVVLVLSDATARTDVSITDALGRVIWNDAVVRKEVIDVSTWQSGTYYLRAGAMSARFMVAR